ncbi:hypothetical protein CTEST_01900 [Corynebacterium testudinoris]|uniref:Uncharacterized protein n=1 Tax=Corynebacterium testudinoris TaxID=136857 RepID=A0A0G3H524_9CORY|nr:hypothetical protein CTEST_01900 [Corynebacterium testudinoris]
MGVRIFPLGCFLHTGLLQLYWRGPDTFGLINAVTLALAIIFLALFGVATVASVLTFRAPAWLLVGLICVGVVTAAVGIYYRIETPDGILTPALIPLGVGVVLAELAVLIDRHVKKVARTRSVNPRAL